MSTKSFSIQRTTQSGVEFLTKKNTWSGDRKDAMTIFSKYQAKVTLASVQMGEECSIIKNESL